MIAERKIWIKREMQIPYELNSPPLGKRRDARVNGISVNLVYFKKLLSAEF